jgi:hypothetical protein
MFHNFVKQQGPWQIRASRQVDRDPWIEVRQDQVIQPDGADGTYCVAVMKPGISVVAPDRNRPVATMR